ncbi:MAG: 3-hydroxyacyl-CoA dehydrogenase NAD-binding domain-containing protein [Pseudomonadota bacterium]
MSYIKLEKDSNNIVELIFDQEGEKVNKMGDEYIAAMTKAVADIAEMHEKDPIAGVYVRSGKDTFFGGGDLNKLLDMPNNPKGDEAKAIYDGVIEAKLPLRQLETLGVPVAVGMNGAALGGGYEIALACHYRVAIDRSDVKMGLPEAQLGLMPGAGGVVRMVRLHGLQDTVTYVSQGKQYAGERALEKKFVDELAKDEDDLHAKAKAWILANPEAKQPWDQPDFKIPGGAPTDKDMDQGLQGLLYFGPVNVMTATNNNFPAPKAIFACIADVARVDFDTAERIEARYFTQLLGSQVAKNMIRTFFFQLNAINGGASRPDGIDETRVNTLGIIGAGQMGAGLAYLAAKQGIKVVLKDINTENAERGLGYVKEAGEKDRRVDEVKAAEIVARVKPTADAADLAPCDFIIEAVFEDRKIKSIVTKECESVIADTSVFASNTSALPITELAEASVRPSNFIGMHFFSPAEKMPLVEIICGEKTSPETLAKTFDLALLLGKTPIVVNDAPGFFTTRVISTTINEGAAMILEGVNPVLIESAAKYNGSPVGPLAAIDEISQATAFKNGEQSKKDTLEQGKEWVEQPAGMLVERMVNEFDRQGKVFGAGYYEYPEGGKKHIWHGLKEHFAPNGYADVPFEDIQDRLTFCQSIEAVRAMEEGVVETVADGNVGSIFGIGFPAQSGGVYQFINAYGLQAFVDRTNYLADKYGEHFRAPKLLVDRAVKNELFV